MVDEIFTLGLMESVIYLLGCVPDCINKRLVKQLKKLLEDFLGLLSLHLKPSRNDFP